MPIWKVCLMYRFCLYALMIDYYKMTFMWLFLKNCLLIIMTVEIKSSLYTEFNFIKSSLLLVYFVNLFGKM